MRNKVGIRQKADVEHQIRIYRHSIFKTETDKRYEQMSDILLREQSAEMFAQFVDCEPRSVHDVIGHEAERRQHLAFVCDRVQLWLVRIQGMRPACLAESSDKHGIGRLEEPQLRLNTGLRLELLEDFRKIVKVLSFPDIDDNGGLGGFTFRLQDQVIKLCKQTDRQVVDAIESPVFKRSEEGSFSR